MQYNLLFEDNIELAIDNIDYIVVGIILHFRIHNHNH